MVVTMKNQNKPNQKVPQMKYDLFYKKYLAIVNDMSVITTGKYTAPSPFGDGAIEVTSDGYFQCHATGKSGTPVDFIKVLYPSVTDPGARLIVSEDNRLTQHTVSRADDLLRDFRKDHDLLEVAAYKLGIRPKELSKYDLFMDKRGFRYHIIDGRSPADKPLSVSTFSPTDVLRISQGIQRPPKKITQRVWVTENQLIAQVVSVMTGDTALCWPKKRELELFDYKSLLKGKDVIALHGELTYIYEESFYPFFENMRQVVNTFADVRYEALCKGEHFLNWIQKADNLSTLEEHAVLSQHLQPIQRTHYENAIRKDDTIEVQYPQASARGYFFYGTQEGLIAQSWPLSIDPVAMAERNYRLRFIQPTRFSENIKLTADRVLSIGQSLTQLTPRNTFDLIKGLIQDHIYFEESEMETLVSLWIMGTYVYSLFPAYPYLHINADKGSGKTTLLELIVQCSFNGIQASRITPANLIQTVSDTQSALCFDEFEKNSGGQGDAQAELLNAGYKRGGNYRRMRGSNTDSMNLYSPKAYASIDSIKTGALASRTLKISMVRKPTHKSLLGWDTEDKRVNKRVNEIMSGGYAIGLFHHYKIEYLMARMKRQIELPSGLSVDGRERELIAPLVVMAQLIDMNKQPGTPSIESELFVALEQLLFPEREEELQRIKILSNQLKEWSNAPENVPHTFKGEICWISNKMWNDTGLLDHFDGRRNDMLDWLKGLSDRMKTKVIHIRGIGTESCIGFPLNLKLNSKEFRDWFSPKTNSEAA